MPTKYQELMAALIFSGFFMSVALATPPLTPSLDGRILEYDDEDVRASYTGGGGAFGPGNSISNLIVTWDADFLYIALQGAEVDNKLVVMLDVDPGNGTGAHTTTNWSGVGPSYIEYNDVGWRKSAATGAVAFGLDYQIASEGFFNNVIQILYDGVAVPNSNTVVSLFDAGNGSSPLGTPVDMAVRGGAPACALVGFEARIPWSVLYPMTGPASNRFGTVLPGEKIPRGAKLRMFANIHNNNPASAYSSNDAIPQQTSPNASWTNGLLVTDTYLDIELDLNNDGLPDLASGDVNAPFIEYAAGRQNSFTVFVGLSESVAAAWMTNAQHWRIGGVAPALVTPLDSKSALLTASTPLPSAGNVVLVTATNLRDSANNHRLTAYCLETTASGLTNPLTVRFVLETASGLGISPGASNFFVNGGSYPLSFGYPPSTNNPLAPLSGTLYYRDVTFPPGTPLELFYKYSGILASTGTNTYEAVRLVDFANAARKLTLPTNVSYLVVTDHLGAAAAPYRAPGNSADYISLYTDPRRGDAGVRQRTLVTFQLDLSARNRSGVSRVLVQGSDPLRGFNYDGFVSDWAGSGAVGWNVGGIELFDDGTRGDLVANDGIYSRAWAWTEDGTDSAIVPGFPYSLVGGDLATLPYAGNGWLDGRSPRSVIYKFYVVKMDNTALESPSSNLELFLENPSVTNLILPPFVWDNNDLPPPPPSNAPSMLAAVRLTGNLVRVVFSNQPGETQHGLLISTNLVHGWMDFGLRVTNGAGGVWTSIVQGANPSHEFYAAYAGPAKTNIGIWFTPNPLPATGGVLRVWYRQHSRSLAGARDVGLTGNWNSWGPGLPMTFVGDGVWYYDLAVSPSAPTAIIFKARTVSENWDNGPDVYAYKGNGRATWTPNSPTNGGLLTITYDSSTGPLNGSPTVSAWVGFDEPWHGVSAIPMTNIGPNLWQLAITVPTNRVLSVNWVFRNAAGTTWDSESTPGGRQYRAFISPPPYP
ncbi:MAG: hypothetical protein NZ740_06600 [Kiritimatiellae bacterium]|nr:hypothetical protein [Kiritimatiellia bacterium]MDW8458766.1 choice-of-anchor X domain-containing protein [Verrucomicrobiota bacterium]